MRTYLALTFNANIDDANFHMVRYDKAIAGIL